MNQALQFHWTRQQKRTRIRLRQMREELEKLRGTKHLSKLLFI